MSIVKGNEVAAEPGPGADRPRRPGRTWRLVFIVLCACFLVLGGYDLVSISGTGQLSGRTAATATAALPIEARVPPSPGPSASPSGSLVPNALTAVSVAAFGPQGTSDGDDPGNVSKINSGGSQPWYTAWYATPEFGDLKTGTGLLFDMGSEVIVSSVRLTLGHEKGADVQIWVGDSPNMAGLTVVAGASDVGGTVQLPVTSQTSGHYVLVWFTKLPPNAQGNYQADVYRAVIDGTAASS